MFSITFFLSTNRADPAKRSVPIIIKSISPSPVSGPNAGATSSITNSSVTIGVGVGEGVGVGVGLASGAAATGSGGTTSTTGGGVVAVEALYMTSTTCSPGDTVAVVLVLLGRV